MNNKNIAFIAHDARKDVMVEWVGRHEDALAKMTIFATCTTGSRIADAYADLAGWCSSSIRCRQCLTLPGR